MRKLIRLFYKKFPDFSEYDPIVGLLIGPDFDIQIKNNSVKEQLFIKKIYKQLFFLLAISAILAIVGTILSLFALTKLYQETGVFLIFTLIVDFFILKQVYLNYLKHKYEFLKPYIKY